MTLTVEITEEMETRLRRKAEREGMDVPAYLQSVVEREANVEGVEEAGSAYDLFAGRVGGIHSGGEGRWSEDCGEKFADGMEEKQRQGHL